MPIALDSITRRKLILVKQLHQRALLQAEVRHSYVDRVLCVVVFDLANETILKAVVGALDTRKAPSENFHGVIQQADELLANKHLELVHDKVKIGRVHSFRNDAQHKAKYPSETDVIDCATYTRDFLKQVALNVWGQGFESISLVDEIQNAKVKGYLGEAEAELAHGNYTEAIIKAEVALTLIVDEIKDCVSARGPWNIVIGLDFRRQTEYKRIVDPIVQGISFAEDGHDLVHLGSPNATQNEAEFAVTHAVDAVIQIESVLGKL